MRHSAAISWQIPSTMIVYYVDSNFPEFGFWGFDWKCDSTGSDKHSAEHTTSHCLHQSIQSTHMCQYDKMPEYNSLAYVSSVNPRLRSSFRVQPSLPEFTLTYTSFKSDRDQRALTRLGWRHLCIIEDFMKALCPRLNNGEIWGQILCHFIGEDITCSASNQCLNQILPISELTAMTWAFGESFMIQNIFILCAVRPFLTAARYDHICLTINAQS